MSTSSTDHEAASTRTTYVIHDVHDIRALTATGAITLPRRRPSDEDDTARSAD